MVGLRCERCLGNGHAETLYTKEFDSVSAAVDFADSTYLAGLGMRRRKKMELCRRGRIFFSYASGFLGEGEPPGVLKLSIR